MEGNIDNANKYLASGEGEQYKQEIDKIADTSAADELGKLSNPGDPQTADPTPEPPTESSTDAFGNQGQAGQHGEEGQYGAVRGKGFGGGLVPEPRGDGQGQAQGGGQDGPQGMQQGGPQGMQQGGPQGMQQGGPQGMQQGGPSAYEGMDAYDSSASGGYGTNKQGSSFSRQNQIGADAGVDPTSGYVDDDEPQGAGYKTGTSTPGYRQEGDVDAQAAENRMRNQNMNVYGQQADDRGASGNDHNQAM